MHFALSITVAGSLACPKSAMTHGSTLAPKRVPLSWPINGRSVMIRHRIGHATALKEQYPLERATSTSYGSGSIEDSVGGFFRDGGESNRADVGHRRWLQSPTLGTVGYGFHHSSSADAAGSYYNVIGGATTSAHPIAFVPIPVLDRFRLNGSPLAFGRYLGL